MGDARRCAACHGELPASRRKFCSDACRRRSARRASICERCGEAFTRDGPGRRILCGTCSEGYKRCPKCGGVRPRDLFSPSRTSADGLASRCRVCAAEEHRRYRADVSNAGSPIPHTKRCSRCSETLPSTEFHRQRTSPDGLHGWCKTCMSRDKKARHKIAVATDKVMPSEKMCPECETWKPSDAFGRDRGRRDGLARVCRDCGRKRILKNTESGVYRDYVRRRRAENPTVRLNHRMGAQVGRMLRGGKASRSWEALVGFTTGELYEHISGLLQASDGMSWDNMDDWHIDHIYPAALFHFDSAEDEGFRLCWSIRNLVPKWCGENRSKSDLLPTGRRARDLSDAERDAWVDEARRYLSDEGADPE